MGFGKSKAALQKALDNTQGQVVFMDPTPFGNKYYDRNTFPEGKHAVVMDPMTRRRFCTVSKLSFNKFKVE
jgi:hypothetical protein